MTASLIALALLPAFVAAVISVVAVAAARSTTVLLAQRARRRVLVTLKTDAAFVGVLYAVDEEALVLRDAEALAYGPQKTAVPVEGELLVLRADVAYLQVLPAAARVPS